MVDKTKFLILGTPRELMTCKLLCLCYCFDEQIRK